MQTELYTQTLADLEANVAQENTLSHIVIWCVTCGGGGGAAQCLLQVAAE
jgi:hypothetical protein